MQLRVLRRSNDDTYLFRICMPTEEHAAGTRFLQGLRTQGATSAGQSVEAQALPIQEMSGVT